MTATAAALETELYASQAMGRLIPASVASIDLDEAYEIQRRVFGMRAVAVAGWKLGATNRLAQERAGLSSPVVGRLASSDILREETEVESPSGMLYAEAELAVVLQYDLRPRAERYDLSEIESAIGPVYAAIELCTSRYADDDVEAPALVADNAFAYRLVLGRTLGFGWNPRFKSMAVTLDCSAGRSVAGSTAAVMDNPIESVVWLANWLSDCGVGLKCGQVIATGSCTGITEAYPGETARASFGGVESASVTIIRRDETGDLDGY